MCHKFACRLDPLGTISFARVMGPKRFLNRRMRKFLLPVLLFSFLHTSGNAFAAHAFSLYDTPKYPAGFKHFDYVNPDAPRGGELFLANPDRRTSFDKFNPFSLKGVSAAGVSNLM